MHADRHGIGVALPTPAGVVLAGLDLCATGANASEFGRRLAALLRLDAGLLLAWLDAADLHNIAEDGWSAVLEATLAADPQTLRQRLELATERLAPSEHPDALANWRRSQDGLDQALTRAAAAGQPVDPLPVLVALADPADTRALGALVQDIREFMHLPAAELAGSHPALRTAGLARALAGANGHGADPDPAAWLPSVGEALALPAPRLAAAGLDGMDTDQERQALLVLRRTRTGLHQLRSALRLDPERADRALGTTLGTRTLLLRQDGAGQLRGIGSRFMRDLVLSTADRTGLGLGGADPVLLDPEGPVLVRQLLRQLGTSDGQCWPLRHAGQSPGAAILAADTGTPELLVRLALDEVARCWATQGGDGEQSARQDRFLHLQDKRIREVLHEVNNPLSIVRNYMHILGLRLTEDAEASRHLELVSDEIRRTSEILERLRSIPADVEHSMTEQRERLSGDLNQSLRRSLQLLEPTTLRPAGVELQLDLDDRLPQLLIDEDALRQVVVNLGRNAAEAMSGGGSLQVATRDRVAADSGQWVEISITDSGPGLPEAVMANLFQPVASTKGDGHAGLGLHIVAQLVTGMGGHIECRSSSTGTSFRVLLPRDLPNPEAAG